MTTYRIPRESSWQIDSELRRLRREVVFEVSRTPVFEELDGDLYAFEDTTLVFAPIEVDYGRIVGTLCEGSSLDLFRDQDFKREDIADKCGICGSLSIHKRMLVVDSSEGLMLLHPRCSGIASAAALTRDVARKVEAATARSQAWAVDQLIRIALLVAGKGAVGFMSRAKANGDLTTADKVIALLTGNDETIYTSYPELDDEVQETLKLARDLDSGGEWANRILANANSENTSEVGLTVSMLVLLQSKRSEENAPKGFVEAYEFDGLKLILTSIKEDVEHWGYNSTLVNKLHFKTIDNRVVFWKTSGGLGVLADSKEGDQVTLTRAILKKKSSWRGCDTTEIKNAKFSGN